MTDQNADLIADLEHLANAGFGICRAQAIDLITALTASEAENARLRDIITSTITAIERGDLYERMCCDGRQCGCMGATNADYVMHLLREALTGGQ